MAKRVMLAGGAGYIGSHTARMFSAAGYEPVIYDNLSTGHRWAVEGCEFHQGDTGDAQAAGAVLKTCEALVHFADRAFVDESVAEPRKYFENNVVSGLALINAALENGIRHVVYSSSCAIYGIPKELPIVESTPRVPVNPYGATKLAMENALAGYDVYGMRSVALRYFNAAGADESGRIGELHDRPRRLITTALHAAAGLRPALAVYGTDYDTPDGTCVRDYVHVNDLASAHVAALQYLERDGKTAALNLGTGKGYSVLEIVEQVRKVTGRDVPVRYEVRRPGDPATLVADPSRAREVLSWQAKRTLPQIIETAWRWLQKQPGAQAASGQN